MGPPSLIAYPPSIPPPICPAWYAPAPVDAGALSFGSAAGDFDGATAIRGPGFGRRVLCVKLVNAFREGVRIVKDLAGHDHADEVESSFPWAAFVGIRLVPGLHFFEREAGVGEVPSGEVHFVVVGVLEGEGGWSGLQRFGTVEGAALTIEVRWSPASVASGATVVVAASVVAGAATVAAGAAVVLGSWSAASSLLSHAANASTAISVSVPSQRQLLLPDLWPSSVLVRQCGTHLGGVWRDLR